jgi:hypothetical protein
LIEVNIQGAGNQITGINGLSLGNQRLIGVDFDIGEKFIQLRGKGFVEDRPSRAGPIHIGYALNRLYILHSEIMSDSTLQGTEVGGIEVTYQDGSKERIPFLHGINIREHWCRANATTGVTEAQIAWTGSSPDSRRYGKRLCLCLSTWANPRPAEIVENLVYYSTFASSGAAPFCIAITTEIDP